MRDISYVVAFFAALFLFTAAVAWSKIYRNPKTDLTTGGGDEPDSKRLKSAAMLTAVSFGLSGLAASLAVMDWFFRQMLAD